MKFLAALIAIIPVLSFAAEEGEITMKSTTPSRSELGLPATNLTEGGFAYSSINNGTPFATIAILHELPNGFSFGARGLMPMQFSKQESPYAAQAVGRFYILNEREQMFIEPTLTYGYFNGRNDTFNFINYGADFGVNHQLNKQFTIGGRIGADYSNARITGDEKVATSVFYNKIAVTGSYVF